MVKFAKGTDAIKEAAESQGGGFSGIRFLSMNDGDLTILRFINDHDEWITLLTHQAVPTRPKPDEWPYDKWPKAMTAISRTDPTFVEDDGTPDGKPMWDEDWITENMVGDQSWNKDKPLTPRPQGWGLAVEREFVYDDDKEIIGVRDKTDKDGNRTYYKVVQSYKNFWSKLRGFAKWHKTCLDRDYVIRCEGKSKDKDYEITALDPIELPEDNPFDLPEGTRFDLRNEKIKAEYTPSFGDAETPEEVLEAIVMELVSQEYYDRWFIPGAPIHLSEEELERAKEMGSDSEAGSTKPSAQDVENEEAMSAMAERLKGYGRKDGEPAEESEEEPKAEAKKPKPAGAMKAM